MEKIIKAAVDRGASDLHIKAGDVFRARIHGKLVPLTKQALTPDQTKAIALHLMPSDDDRAHIDRIQEIQPWFQGDYVLILTDGTRLTSTRGYRDNMRRLLGRSA